MSCLARQFLENVVIYLFPLRHIVFQFGYDGQII